MRGFGVDTWHLVGVKLRTCIWRGRTIVTMCDSSHIPQKSICDEQTRSRIPSPPHRSPPARPTIIDARIRSRNTFQYVHTLFTRSPIVCLRSPFLHVSSAHGMRATLPLPASRDAVWLLATKTRHAYRYCEQRMRTRRSMQRSLFLTLLNLTVVHAASVRHHTSILLLPD